MSELDFNKGIVEARFEALRDRADNSDPPDQDEVAARAAQIELEREIREEHEEMMSGRTPQLDPSKDNFIHLWHHLEELKKEDAPPQMKEAISNHLTDTIRQMAGLPFRKRF